MVVATDKKIKNPLYVVSSNKKDVEEVEDMFSLWCKKLGLDAFWRHLMAFAESFMRHMPPFIPLEVIATQWNEFWKNVETLLTNMMIFMDQAQRRFSSGKI